MIDKLIEKNPKKAHNKFNKLYQEFKSPRALFDLAVSLNKLAMASSDTNEAAKLQGIAADKFCQVMSLNQRSTQSCCTKMTLLNTARITMMLLSVRFAQLFISFIREGFQKFFIIFMEFSMEGSPPPAPLPWKIINFFPTIF